ncbi:hypothetical protein [Halocatena marina]|uniref:hypothetical protein n=1 Tax=Halocatena marina TaxID=2934937 RepID=UPI00200EE19F|nr:hypothetical protein [Halocatena marina]
MGSDTASLSVDRWAVVVRVRLRAIISMLRLRRLAIVLIAIGLITSAIYATGAFSNLSASRDANVRVAGDASGYLALQPSDGPNGAYATQQNGRLRVSLTEVATAKGKGVNPNAITRVQNVFTITNQGTQPVEVWLTDDSDAVAFERGTAGAPFEGRGQAVTLQPGTPLTVSVAVDTREVEQGSKLQPSMTLHTSTDVSSARAGGPIETGTSGGQASGGGTKQSDTERTQPNEKDTTNPDTESDSDSMVTIAGITLQEDDATAFKDGLVYGATGMPDGAQTQSTHASPFYALAHMAVGFVPGLGDAADVRDAIQHGANGKWGEAIISGMAIAPVVGASANSAKALDFAKDWIKRFPSKGDEIGSLLAKHVAPHMPDSLSVKLLDIFSGGKASELKQSGKSVDEIINRAEKGALSKKPKKNPNEGKRLVTDGGRSTADIKKTIQNGRFVDDGLTDANYRHIGKQGNVDETMMAVNPKQKRWGDGEVVWLEKGNGGAGWKHILQRHEDQFYKRYKVSNKDEMMDIIYKTIKEGEPKRIPEKEGGGTAYGYVTDSGEPISVIVGDNGYIVTSIPAKSKYH